MLGSRRSFFLLFCILSVPTVTGCLKPTWNGGLAGLLFLFWVILFFFGLIILAF